MELVRKTNSTYNQVNSNLKILEKEQIIFDNHLGHRRVIRIDKQNPRISQLSQLLKLLSKSE